MASTDLLTHCVSGTVERRQSRGSYNYFRGDFVVASSNMEPPANTIRYVVYISLNYC